MAGDAYSSPFHFNRQLSRGAGEPPVAMKRRVMLERAAWQLRQGASVTDTAFEAGYESVEGFSRAFARAFGNAPSVAAKASGSHWLPAPNGIHFHPPTSLWVHAKEQSMNPLTEQLVAHDLDDTRALLEAAKQLSDEDYRRPHLPGNTVLGFDGPDESVAHVLTHLVFTKEVWLAAIEGTDFPPERADDVGTLLDRHEDAAARWLATVRDIDRRGAWDDRLIDALCDPPESFVMSSVVAHVLTFSAHRRQLARQLLRASGQEVDSGDPINWLRARHGEAQEVEPVTRTTFYTAMTLDGFLADEHDSLDWLFVQDQDEKGPLNYDEFIKDIGAIVMGATTYEWILRHLAETGEAWPYTIPAWVVSAPRAGRRGGRRHPVRPGRRRAAARRAGGGRGRQGRLGVRRRRPRRPVRRGGQARRGDLLHRAGHPGRGAAAVPAPLRLPAGRGAPEQGVHRRALRGGRSPVRRLRP